MFSGVKMLLMKHILFILLFFASLFVVSGVDAKYDPFITANNKFGIHILNESDIPEASRLVNSNGGSWGYVTLVIREDEKDVGRWEGFFNELKAKRLIPIVRLATKTENGNWAKPGEDSAQTWKEFLDKLPWPISNRYVVVFNEPNHRGEWGGELNPEEYASILDSFVDQFNDDYFVLPAGLDVAAPNSANWKEV